MKNKKIEIDIKTDDYERERKTDEANEVWAYDEPHQSGGNAHITMTKRQAVEWMRHVYGNVYDGNDQKAFNEFVAVHWAYKEKGQE